MLIETVKLVFITSKITACQNVFSLKLLGRWSYHTVKSFLTSDPNLGEFLGSAETEIPLSMYLNSNYGNE